MGSRFVAEVAANALRFRREWQYDEGLTGPPRGGGGTNAGQRGPSTAGRVSSGFSARSRRGMRWQFAGLPWEMLGDRPAMLTLTYPGDWQRWCPDARAFVRHRKALQERWRRRYGAPVGVWVAEFQRRGAPHLHLYVGLPAAMGAEEYVGLQRRTIRRRRREREVGGFSARQEIEPVQGPVSEWLRTAWWQVVGSNSRAHRARGVDIATVFWSEAAAGTVDRSQVADYFWRESGKWGQKEAPPGFGSLKFYDFWGRHVGFRPQASEAELSRSVYVEARRVARRWSLDRGRRAFGVEARGARSRGLDGFTVYGATPGWSVGLLSWAEEAAVWKAGRGFAPHVRDGAAARAAARKARLDARDMERLVAALEAEQEADAREVERLVAGLEFEREGPGW